MALGWGARGNACVTADALGFLDPQRRPPPGLGAAACSHALFPAPAGCLCVAHGLAFPVTTDEDERSCRDYIHECLPP